MGSLNAVYPLVWGLPIQESDFTGRGRQSRIVGHKKWQGVRMKPAALPVLRENDLKVTTISRLPEGSGLNFLLGCGRWRLSRLCDT